MATAKSNRLTLQNSFDLAKKKSEGGNPDTGYCIDGRVFYAYMTNVEWGEFVRRMPGEFANRFEHGQGGEMKERKTRHGNYVPPKMCSYGSSSRMLYELANNIPDFIFEYELPTVIGGKAHLDGYKENGNIYVEAKCREIYGDKEEVSAVYDQLYEYLSRTTLLRYERNENKVSFNWGTKEIEHFDLKQMLCHLLGIANHNLCNGIAPVNFLYMVYKPTPELLSFLNEDDRKRIQEIWKQEKQEAESIDFKCLYRHIILFFREKMSIGTNITAEQVCEMEQSFSFLFCTQYDFKEQLTRISNVTI